MKIAMISQPMNGLTAEEIEKTKKEAEDFLKYQDMEVVNTYFNAGYEFDNAIWKNKPLCFLAKSLLYMSRCDCVFFCKGWELARGCKLEHDAAVAYGLEIIYEV